MKRKIIAVTACTTGVAHTYLAAQALKRAAKELDCLIKVETQGATGIDNELNERDLELAEVVILAVDTKVSGNERFKGKLVLKVPVSEPLKQGKQVIIDALKLVDKQ